MQHHPTQERTMLNDGSSAPLQMFDGERLRDVWVPGDGPGDGDVDLVRTGQTRKGGHPTWKIYATDVPEGVESSIEYPPRRVYLDDKACYDLLSSNAFSGNQMGKCWPYDFTQVGKVRATRPNRGRPARLENGEIATSYRPTGAYYFSGEADRPNENEEHDSPPERQSSLGPDPMFEAQSHVEGAPEQEGMEGVDDYSNTADIESSTNTHTMRRFQTNSDLLAKPLDSMDEDDLEELQQAYTTAIKEADGAHIQIARLRHQCKKAEHNLLTVSEERDVLQDKLQLTMSRLETKHRDNVELDIAIKRHSHDNLVTKRMLEKAKDELRKLKLPHALPNESGEPSSGEESGRLRQEHRVLNELCKVLYVGHLSSKATLEEINAENSESLSDTLEPFCRIEKVVDEGIEAIKDEMENNGLGHILEELAATVSSDAGMDVESMESVESGR